VGLWLGLAHEIAGCGYQPAYAPTAGPAISVGIGQTLVPDVSAAQAALGAARAELAASGRLSVTPSFPRLMLDVLRVDEVSRGVHVESGQPKASGMGVGVVVRGRLLDAPDQPPALDTGDVRRAVQLSAAGDPRTDSALHDEATRAAAERAGRAVARIALGIPEPADEAP
jgi:hypothetical protein